MKNIGFKAATWLVLLLFFVGCESKAPQWLTSYSGTFTAEYQGVAYSGTFIRNFLGCGQFTVKEPTDFAGLTVTLQDGKVQYSFEDMEIQGEADSFSATGVFQWVVLVLDAAARAEESVPEYEDKELAVYRGTCNGESYSITYDKTKKHPISLAIDRGMLVNFSRVSPYDPVG